MNPYGNDWKFHEIYNFYVTKCFDLLGFKMFASSSEIDYSSWQSALWVGVHTQSQWLQSDQCKHETPSIYLHWMKKYVICLYICFLPFIQTEPLNNRWQSSKLKYWKGLLIKFNWSQNYSQSMSLNNTADKWMKLPYSYY